MGIKYLTSLVKQNSSILNARQDIRNNTLVIDGNCHFHALLAGSPSFHYGGNYQEIYKLFYGHLENILIHNVEIYVIFDGSINIDTKMDTWKERKKAQLSCIEKFYETGIPNRRLPVPRFYVDVCVEVLKELNIKYAFAQREADPVVASVANKVGGFVVSNDSDFFIFDIHTGVINHDQILKVNKNNSKVEVFKRKLLASFFNTNEEHLYFIPVLMGCDFSYEPFLKHFRSCVKLHDKSSIDETVAILKTVLSLSRYNLNRQLTCDDTDLNDEIDKIVKEYNLQEVEIDGDRCLRVMCSDIKLQPIKDFSSSYEALKVLVCKGLMNSSVINILIGKANLFAALLEDSEQTPSTSLTAEFRKYVYGILFKYSKADISVTEYIPSQANIRTASVFVTPEYSPPVISSKADALSFLFEVFQCEIKIPENLERHTLFILVSRYLFRSSYPRFQIFIEKNISLAYILCYSILQNEQTDWLRFFPSCISGLELHINSCWQEIAYEAILINRLLGNPVEQYQIHKTFDAQIIHYLYMEKTNDFYMEGKRVIPVYKRYGYVVKDLYESLKNAIL